MGQWGEFCSVCGGPLWIDREYKQRWLKDIVGLAPDGVDVRLYGYNGYGAFFTVDGGLFDSKTNVTLGNATMGAAHGVVCHRQCLRLVRGLGSR
jgi:hypothetical protein